MYKISFVFVVLLLFGFQDILAQDSNGNLSIIVEEALKDAGIDIPAGIELNNIKSVEGWYSGTVAILAPQEQNASPDFRYFLAREVDTTYDVAIEYTDAYTTLVAQAPENLNGFSVNTEGLLVAPMRIASANLSLPFGIHETWILTGGPHNALDGFSQPFSALDFAGGSQIVRAAADGVVSRPCANFVVIDHGNSYQTSYYHVTAISVSHGQSVARGQVLGQISAESGCGGGASGAHQHFALRQNGQYISMNGQDIGGWTVQDGSTAYTGCLVRIRDGARICQNGAIYNDGTIGSGNNMGGGTDPSINLLDNGSFENNLTSWRYFPTATSSQCPWTTQYPGAVDASKMLSTHRIDDSRCTSLVQDVTTPVIAGQTYTLYLQGRRGWDGPDRRARLSVWLGAGTSGQENRANEFVLNGNWHCAQVQITAQRSHNNVRFEVYLDSPGQPDYQFDDMRLVRGAQPWCTPTNVTSQPQNQSVRDGGNATFAVNAVGELIRYQWQQNSDGNWRDIANANSSSYVASNITRLQNGTQYRVRVAGNNGVQVSSAATLTVTEPPPVNTLNLKALPSTSQLRVGDSLEVDFVLEAPELAAGGGVYAVEATCSLLPEVIRAQSLVSGTLFAPDPAIISPEIGVDNSFLYAVSQSGSNPAISQQGIVFSLNASAQQAGQTTLTCNVVAIDATNAQISIPFTPVTLTVQEPLPTTGIVSGVVRRSHAHDENILVELLSANGDIIASGTTQTDASFTLADIPAGSYTIRATTGGYLFAQGTVNVMEGQTVVMPEVTLLAGDVAIGNPVVVDELDVIQLAINYGQQVPPASPDADLTRDTLIGLPDLRALSENLRATGPIDWR